MEGMNQSLHTAIQGENEVNIFVSKWERRGMVKVGKRYIIS